MRSLRFWRLFWPKDVTSLKLGLFGQKWQNTLHVHVTAQGRPRLNCRGLGFGSHGSSSKFWLAQKWVKKGTLFFFRRVSGLGPKNVIFWHFSGFHHFGEIRISGREKPDPLAPRFSRDQNGQKWGIFGIFGFEFEAVKAHFGGFFKNSHFWPPLVGGHFWKFRPNFQI